MARGRKKEKPVKTDPMAIGETAGIAALYYSVIYGVLPEVALSKVCGVKIPGGQRQLVRDVLPTLEGLDMTLREKAVLMGINPDYIYSVIWHATTETEVKGRTIRK